MIVIDTSALIDRLLGRPKSPELADRIDDEDLHAPHLVDAEFLHALRRLERHIGSERSAAALLDFSELPILRYPHVGLRERAWRMRRTITAYDAMFLALAEAIDAPLITCDARLARSSGHRARIELFQ